MEQSSVSKKVNLQRKKGRRKRAATMKEESLKSLLTALGGHRVLDQCSDPMEEFDFDDPLCPSSDDDDVTANVLHRDHWINESDNEDFSKVLSADPEFLKGKKEAEDQEKLRPFHRSMSDMEMRLFEKELETIAQRREPEKETAIGQTTPAAQALPGKPKSADGQARGYKQSVKAEESEMKAEGFKEMKSDRSKIKVKVEEKKKGILESPLAQPEKTADGGNVNAEQRQDESPKSEKEKTFEEIEDWKTAVIREMAAWRSDIVLPLSEEDYPLWLKPITDLEKRDLETDPIDDEKRKQEDSESQD